MTKMTVRFALPVMAAMVAGLLTGASEAPVRAAPIAAPAPLAEAGKPVALASHRAVYDLKLAKSSGSRGIQAVRGRILYDFGGSTCEGYQLNFRQVSELDSGEGKTVLSDLRSNTWENAEATKFRFDSENTLNQMVKDTVKGRAERGAAGVTVDLDKPTDKTFDVPADVVFPTDHMRRIVEAARAGKSILEFPVYDGSDTGEKVYNTLTVIGGAIDSATKPADDASGKEAGLNGMRRWPVTVSYFDKKSDEAERTGEQTPVYAIAFELYENGISRALTLDYNDFTIKGELTSLEMKKEKACK